MESLFKLQGADSGLDNLPFESIRQYVFSSDAAIKLGLANTITAEAGRDSSLVIMEYSRYALVTQDERLRALNEKLNLVKGSNLKLDEKKAYEDLIIKARDVDVRQARAVFPSLALIVDPKPNSSDTTTNSALKKVTFKYGISMRFKFWLKKVKVSGSGKLFGFIDLGGTRYKSEVSGLEGDLIGVSHPELTQLMLPDITAAAGTSNAADGPASKLSEVSVQTVMKGFRELVQKLGKLQGEKEQPVYNPMLFGAFEEVPEGLAVDPKKFQSGAATEKKKGS
jgi:hypothetical protein